MIVEIVGKFQILIILQGFSRSNLPTFFALGGVISGSLAIMTDAAHLLTDVAAFCVSLFSIYMAGRPATQTMSFGYHRIEVLGAIVSVLLIWLVTGALVIVAIERIVSGDFEIDAGIMLITSGLGLLFNVM